MHKKLNQNGSFDPLIIPLVVSIVLLLGASGFGIWSYTQYLDASEVEQAEIDEAVAEAESNLTEELELAFAEREKQPNRTYTSPGSTGSVKIVYPKTWSVYSQEDVDNGEVDAHFNPKYVRAVKDEAPVALRMTVENKSYDKIMEGFAKRAERGEVTVKATKINGHVGSRVNGNIIDEFTGSMVIFPIREKTLTVWTENNSFGPDFDNIVLANLEFSP